MKCAVPVFFCWFGMMLPHLGTSLMSENVDGWAGNVGVMCRCLGTRPGVSARTYNTYVHS